mmetsp:Transcript_21714/g.26770  ORF Transcript_21714/g.26770 Transcript_21714/m.26770 type:complete len:157 (-) Transcript_21714:28-498(-)
MARRMSFLWMMLFSCVSGDMEHQERLTKLAELLEEEGDNLKAMATALHKESSAAEDALSRQEEAAAIRAAASGTSMLNLGGEALSSSVKGLRGSELIQTAQPVGAAVDFEAIDGGSGELDSKLDQTRGSRTVGKPSSQVGTLSREEKRLQDLLGLR